VADPVVRQGVGLVLVFLGICALAGWFLMSAEPISTAALIVVPTVVGALCGSGLVLFLTGSRRRS
jgi:asparagine N-glycosylation enzyme membrane subunit Stt3